VQFDGKNVTRVGLAAGARDWFDSLPRLGEVLHLVRNSIATLGCLGVFPKLVNWRNEILPCDSAGILRPHLADYASLWAVKETAEAGVLHGLEVRDIAGNAFEKVVLVNQSDRDWFEQFVTAHQSPAEQAGAWCSPNHTVSQKHRSRLSGRVPWLQIRSKGDGWDVHSPPIEFLPRLLVKAAELKIPLKTVHHSPALMRTAIWTPHAAEGSPGSFHDQRTILNLNLRTISGLWLWTSQEDGLEQTWSVEVSDSQNRLALTLTAADASLEPVWRNLLWSIRV
jgi:hypothetical protein